MKKIVILFFAVLAQAVYVFGEELARELERECAKKGMCVLPDASHTPFRDSVRVSCWYISASRWLHGVKDRESMLVSAAASSTICGGILEYPQFLTLETGRMPDSIGQDAFSEVK